MVKRRCSECRKRFTPAVSACGHQRVCGEACRCLRRNRLARLRRCDDLDEQRADERERQQRRRDASRATKCHELASGANSSELLRKVQEIVDKAASLSRATIRRDLMRVLRGNRPLFGLQKWTERADVTSYPPRCKQGKMALEPPFRGTMSRAGLVPDEAIVVGSRT